jgi:hypothetical protein
MRFRYKQKLFLRIVSNVDKLGGSSFPLTFVLLRNEASLIADIR